MQFELLVTEESASSLGEKVACLIEKVIPQPDVSYTVPYYLSGLAPNRRPRMVACYEGAQLVGVLYANELMFAGLGTGFVFGGDLMGRGLLLASAEREKEVFEATCSFLLEKGYHALRFNWTPQQSLSMQPPNGSALRLQADGAQVRHVPDPHPEGDWLELSRDYESFLAKLGSHTRRNLRYYRRKVEGLGYAFTGLLHQDELSSALNSLNRVADYPMDQSRLDRDRRFFATFKTPVVAGLRNSNGQFISLITGFTSGKHLHVLSQLNGENAILRKLSVSLVLRGFIIEEFIRNGFTHVHFIHGSSPMLGRFCREVDLQIVWIDNVRSWTTPFKRLCAALAHYLRRKHKHVPYRLQVAAGSFLRVSAPRDAD